MAMLPAGIEQGTPDTCMWLHWHCLH
uniref:Uncharacterized protein n=1 Tax=Arundo donax TaxID=35708 RepID=A0A0A8YYL6_ARUDO